MGVAILDVDGTLVDTNYHHAIAWYRAFRRFGITLPLWRLHVTSAWGATSRLPRSRATIATMVGDTPWDVEGGSPGGRRDDLRRHGWIRRG